MSLNPTIVIKKEKLILIHIIIMLEKYIFI